MDIIQRRSIEQMRSSGVSYSSIANALGLSVNTVKSYCRRSNMSTEVLPDTKPDYGNNCENCGGFLPQASKQRRFCSDTCRKAFWKTHFDQLNKVALYPKTCAHCGVIFMSYGNRKRKYCSHPCYIAARFGKAAKQ